MGAVTRRRLGVVGLALTGGIAVSLIGMGTPTTPPAAAAAELEPFDDCAELRQWYVDASLPQVGPWGLGGSPIGMYAVEGPLARDTIPTTAGVAEDAVSNGETGTNVQEAGVDEPDIAKTDGEILVTIRNRAMLVFDVTGDEPQRIGRLPLDEDMWGAELLLVGDRVLVLSGAGGYYGGPVMLDVIALDTRVAPGYWGYPNRTTLMTVDVSDPGKPSVVDTTTLEASLVSARQYGDVVRIVTTSSPTLDFVHPTRNRTNNEAKQKNRRIVRESAAEDWLPRDDEGEPTMSCTDVSRPQNATALSTISIITMDPAAPEQRDTIGVAADGNLVYSSPDRLYVATTGWGWGWGWSLRSQPVRTDIHAFAMTGAETAYVASGDVVGMVPDRWAFSEYDGDLRVASTRGNGSESLVSVLTEQGDDLELVGSVGGMGKGEDIKAVRWFGDIAVVVTFRTVDPLYTLDLSEPTDPRVLGELKIPGFSEYLHPVGDDLLLGVGQHAGRGGFTRGSQVQTFDLGDLTDPRQVTSLRFDSDYSPVEADSRSFTYLPEQRLALVPTGSWRGGSTLEVVRVGEDGGLESVAGIASSGWTESVRALPLGGDRVALVSGGQVEQIIDVTAL